jgi:hypothetical protein
LLPIHAALYFTVERVLLCGAMRQFPRPPSSIAVDGELGDEVAHGDGSSGIDDNGRDTIEKDES